jgi:hypothetical protein
MMNRKQELFQDWIMSDHTRSFMYSVAKLTDNNYVSYITQEAWNIWQEAYAAGKED